MLGWRQSCLPLGRRTFATVSKPFIYADRALLVMNKPPEWNSQLDNKPTLKDVGESSLKGVIQQYKREHQLSNVWVCHRLDKVTTGAMLLATTEAGVKEINTQFAARTIDKVYLALVRAGTDAFKDVRSGELTQPVHQDPEGKMSLSKSAKGPGVYSATTRWEVVTSSPIAPVSLVKFMPTTGRKHQIRLHASYGLKCPILGEKLYTTSRPAVEVREALGHLLQSDRLFLHASSLTLLRYRKEGPKKQFRLGITAPLPVDFVEACKKLKITLPKELVQGGISVDGEFVESGVVEDLEGRWLL